MLFLRVLSVLQQKAGLRIGVIDFPGGWISEQLSAQNIPFDFIDHEQGPARLASDDIVLAPTSYARIMFRYVDRSSPARIFFWTIHPMNLQPLPNWIKSDPARIPNFLWPLVRMIFYLPRLMFRRFINVGATQQAIAFMDGANLDAFQQHLRGPVTQPILLPIPVDLPPAHETEARMAPNSNGCLPTRFGWLGRIDNGFKLFALQRAVQDVSDWAGESGQAGIVFYVIGNGTGLNLLTEWAGKTPLNLKLEYMGPRQGAQLDDALRHLDVLMAMGTSALEGAARSIPTLITDFSYIPVKSPRQYNWLFDQTDFDLGRNVQDNLSRPTTGYLSELLRSFDKDRLGNECQRYVRDSHSMEKQWQLIARRFLGSNLGVAEYARKMSRLWFK